MTGAISSVRNLPGSVQVVLISIIAVGVLLAALRISLAPGEEALMRSVSGRLSAQAESDAAARGETVAVTQAPEAEDEAPAEAAGETPALEATAAPVLPTVGEATQTTSGLDAILVGWDPSQGIGQIHGGGAVISERPLNGIFMFATVQLTNSTDGPQIIESERIFLVTAEGAKIAIDARGSMALSTMPPPGSRARALSGTQSIPERGFTTQVIAVFDINPDLVGLTLDFEGARFALPAFDEIEGAEGIMAGLPGVGQYTNADSGLEVRFIAFESAETIGDGLQPRNGVFHIVRLGFSNQSNSNLVVSPEEIVLLTLDDRRIGASDDAMSELNVAPSEDASEGRPLMVPTQLLPSENANFILAYDVDPDVGILRLDIEGLLFVAPSE